MFRCIFDGKGPFSFSQRLGDRKGFCPTEVGSCQRVFVFFDLSKGSLCGELSSQAPSFGAKVKKAVGDLESEGVVFHHQKSVS